MTTEPTPALCGGLEPVPRLLLDRSGRWRGDPSVAVEQIVAARCVHIVFEPLMPPDYIQELVRRAMNAANRILVFCTIADLSASGLAEMSGVDVFGLLTPV